MNVRQRVLYARPAASQDLCFAIHEFEFCISSFIVQTQAHLMKCQADVLLEALRRATSEPVAIPNLLTSARVAVNAFKHSVLRNWAEKNRSEVCDIYPFCSFPLSSYQINLRRLLEISF